MTIQNSDADQVRLAYQLFLEALEKNTVEDLIEAAYAVFKRPVLITDETYHLICMYPQQRLGFPIWDTLYEQNTLPLDTIVEYQKAFLENMSKIYDPFFADYGLAKENPRIFGEIYTPDQQILGHVAIFMAGTKLQDNDLVLTKIFLKFLSIYFSQKRNQKITTSQALKDMLDHESSKQTKEQALGVIKNKLQKNYVIIASYVGNAASRHAYATLAQIRQMHSFPNTISTIYHDYIVTLAGNFISSHEFSAFDTSRIMEIADQLCQQFNNAGISEAFDDLDTCDIHFIQAQSVTNLGRKQSAFFSDFRSQALFSFFKSHIASETFLHPVLAKISAYDQEHGTEYFETLRIYILCFFNRDTTASILNIHRNTLQYRLNRIQDIFNLAYMEPQITLQLLNSFQLLEKTDV